MNEGRLPPPNARTSPKDLLKLVQQMKLEADIWPTVTKTATTVGTGLATTAWFDTVPLGVSTYRAQVIGGGASGGYAALIYVNILNVGGVQSVIGGVQDKLYEREDAAAMNSTFALAADVLSLQVQDDGVAAMTWTVIVSRARSV